MTPEELEQAILDTIQKVYRKKYVGKIKCLPTVGNYGWTIVLGLGCNEKPITISAELPDDKFLQFFEQELRDRDWNTVHWFTGYQYLDDGCPINKSCKCND